MKKRLLKKGVLAGTIFTAALNFNACAYGPPGGMGGVYMPEDATSENTNISETVESTDTLESSEMLEGSETVESPETASRESGEKEENSENAERGSAPNAEFDPSQNIQAPVYGPPEMMR